MSSLCRQREHCLGLLRLPSVCFCFFEKCVICPYTRERSCRLFSVSIFSESFTVLRRYKFLGKFGDGVCLFLQSGSLLRSGLLRVFLFLLILALATFCIAQDTRTNPQAIGNPQQPVDFVYDFIISVHGKVEISHDSAAGVPVSGYLLQEPFQFPKPSKFSLPAGTRIFQESKGGWDGLRFMLPNGISLHPSKREIVGLEVRVRPDKMLATMLDGPSTTARRYIDKLRSIKKETGNAPSLNAYRNLLLSPNLRLSSMDYRYVKAAFITMQSPQLTLEELRVLRSSLRNSISTFHASWTVEYTLNNPSNTSFERFKSGKFDFWMDSNKLRYDVLRGPNLNDLQFTARRSYDGSVERVVDMDTDGKRAIMHPIIAISYYFEEQNPLWLAKLIDNQRDLGKVKAGLENFQNRYAYPLEETVTFHGTQCIPLLEQDTVYFLDPKRNYAYCGMEAGAFIFNEKEGKLIKTDLRYTHVIEKFQNCGNGVWLPMKSVEKRYIHGIPEYTIATNVTLAEVNKTIAPDIFTQVIPNGVEVFDGTRGVAYVQGRSKSIGDNVERVVLRRKGSSWGNVMIGVNLVLIGTFFVFYGWKFFLGKRL